MPTIILMRHANAEPASAGMRDFDRPLSKAGWAEGKIATNLLKATGLAPTKVLCSPARRTLETLACVRGIIALADGIVTLPQELYSGDVGAYQNLAYSVPEKSICMLIGHNPMIERFAFQLALTGEKAILNRLKTGVPTATIAVFQLDGDYAAANPQSELLHLLTV